jgi:hypothetical protein
MESKPSQMFNVPSLPASRVMPSRPTTTQEPLHSAQTSLSLPSFIQPHFAAATASIAGGLFAYVASLYVKSRDRNDGIEDGRYSVAVDKGKIDFV